VRADVAQQQSMPRKSTEHNLDLEFNSPDLFDRHGVSFVSITQSFNTTTSMGRLTLNVLLSFAQFEREVIGERVRDKIAASSPARIPRISAPSTHWLKSPFWA